MKGKRDQDDSKGIKFEVERKEGERRRERSQRMRGERKRDRE